MTPRRSRKSRYKSSAYTSSRGEITPTTRNDLYRPCIKNLYLRRDESRLAIIGEGRAMGKPKCRAFRLLRYFLLSLCLSLHPSGETRSICFSRDAASTSQVSPLYFREIVDSFLRPFVPNIFTEYLFFPSFFLPFFFFSSDASFETSKFERDGGGRVANSDLRAIVD